jgi:sigma-B regulation protein RsbU (phosphoserine phosphatase)
MDAHPPHTGPRFDLVVEMLRDLSRATTPGEVNRSFILRSLRLRPVDYTISLSTRGLEPGHYRITRRTDIVPVLRGDITPTFPDYPAPSRDLPVHSTGFLAGVIADARPKIATDLHVAGDPVLGDEIAQMRSALAIPLYDEGEPKNWNLQFRRGAEGFSPSDCETTIMTANLVGGTNRRMGLTREVRDLNNRLQKQFEDLARIQRALLPSEIPDIPGLKIATSYLTSDQAGGDYYDFFKFDNGKWGILIADVSGHGAAAAAVMAMLHAILHAYRSTIDADEVRPDRVLNFANKRLCAASIESSFVTAFFAVYDPAEATLTYSRSGHNPPRFKKGASGDICSIDGAGSLPLGVFEDSGLTSETLRLSPNDTVILYTDGITEAFNPRREMFGVDRLDEALHGCSGDPDCVVDSVHTALYAHTGSRTRADDQTIVAFRFLG